MSAHTQRMTNRNTSENAWSVRRWMSSSGVTITYKAAVSRRAEEVAR